MRSIRPRAAALVTGVSVLLTLGTPALMTAPASAAVAPAVSAAVPAVAFLAPAALTARTADPFRGKTAPAVLALSVRAMKAASSVHIKLHALDEKKAVTDIDAVITSKGARSTLTITGGGTSTVLRVGSKAWLSGNADFWRSGGVDDGTVATLIGHWIPLSPKNKEDKALIESTTTAHWVGILTGVNVAKRVAGKVVRKLPTVGLLGESGTIFVAAKGKPYPLLEVDPDGLGTISLFDWGKKVTIKAPKASLVLKG